ncbi:MAG: YggS family pyridoxal phosphate-dependent enzyme [Chloroflexota bacterium]
MNLRQQIVDNYHQVLERLTKAAQSANRKPEDIKLIVVTKARPVEIVQAVVDAGARFLGENYPEEGVEKMAFSASENVEWHMIGHIQSRKAKMVVENYAWVHAVDRMKIANRLNRFAQERNLQLPVLLEFNVSGEASKYGWSAWDQSRWFELAESLNPLFDLDHLQIRGLMTMPPFTSDPEDARPFFRRLRLLKSFLAEQFPDTNWDHLSMGMSNDFEVAVQEGATMVRVGTAIVGQRR